MKQAVFLGAATALITPMHRDGSVNFDEMKNLVEWQINQGIDALVVCGTTGECATLSREEHLQVIACVVDQAAGRVPVVAGSGSNDTAFSVITSKEAAAIGASALMSVTPYYNKTTQEGLVRHFCTIAEAASLPLIVYNVPARTGMDISLETCQILAAHPLIAGIKEASGDVAKASRIIASCGADLPVYCGNDEIAAPIFAMGGKGAVSVVSNLLPDQMADLCRRGLDDDLAGCREMQLRLLGLIDALFAQVNPIPVKKAMNLAGWQAGPCRLPLTDPSSQTVRCLEKEMARLGVLLQKRGGEAG
ncbi:MAG: 4-hydroxy-tetrahydrodipicolinate synthase [Oscillospiraceae bacterium]|nr:4-hydroxy-tetrahydrodipicolinate synthase [Oscillospiraceae bacterium]